MAKPLTLDELADNPLMLPADFGAVTTVGLAAGNHDAPGNKRVHVYFNHEGLLPVFLMESKESIDNILSSVWASFGHVIDTYYHAEYSFGFLTFATHEHAAAAINKLKDDTKVREAIEKVVAAQSTPATKARVKQITDRLFVHRNGVGRLLMPSWAAPRQR